MRLKRHPAVLGVLATCDARANVTITVKAVAARKGKLKAFSLQFGSLQATVGAGRPTVLVIKPSAGVVGVLRAAARRHQRVSLKLTLTASSHATRTTTTTRVSAIRIRVDIAARAMIRRDERADVGRQPVAVEPVRLGELDQVDVEAAIGDVRLEQVHVVPMVVGVREQHAEVLPVLDPAAELLVHLAPGGVDRNLASLDRASREVPVTAAVGVADEQHVVVVQQHALDPDDLRPDEEPVHPEADVRAAHRDPLDLEGQGHAV